MITLNIKLWSWIIITIIFLVYNLFFNKSEGGIDVSPVFRFGISVVLYLIFWIIWLIVFK